MAKQASKQVILTIRLDFDLALYTLANYEEVMPLKTSVYIESTRFITERPELVACNACDHGEKDKTWCTPEENAQHGSDCVSCDKGYIALESYGRTLRTGGCN